MHVWLVSQPKTFYSGHKADCAVMDKVHCIKQGDYVEKLCSCKISVLVFINMKYTVRIIIDSPSYFAVLHIRGAVPRTNMAKFPKFYRTF